MFECVPGRECYSTGEDVLSAFQYDNLPLWGAVGANLGIMLLLTILGYVFFQKTSGPSELLETLNPATKQLSGSTVVPINSEIKEENSEAKEVNSETKES